MKRRRGKVWALGLIPALLFCAAAWAQSAVAPFGAPLRIAQADTVLSRQRALQKVSSAWVPLL